MTGHADIVNSPGGTADIELFEMANLPTKDTGVDGTIHISTAQGSHGPRVKWYPGRPGREAPSLSVTVERKPRSINHGLPQAIAQAAANQVAAWVALNHDRLADFWSHGETWTRDEVNAFIDSLEKLT